MGFSSQGGGGVRGIHKNYNGRVLPRKFKTKKGVHFSYTIIKHRTNIKTSRNIWIGGRNSGRGGIYSRKSGSGSRKSGSGSGKSSGGDGGGSRLTGWVHDSDHMTKVEVGSTLQHVRRKLYNNECHLSTCIDA